MTRIEDQGFSDAVASPIIVRGDRADRDGDLPLLAHLRCDLQKGELHWVIQLRAGTDDAHGK